MSLTRLGARMTGLDISPPALAEARALAEAAGADATFVESEVYSAVDALGAGRFDLVYTGVGALCWLPDIRRWAGVVAELLRPGGRLHIREGHPMLWSLADAREDRLLAIEHPYFETADAIVWDEGDEGTTYVETDVVFSKNVTHEWNHGLGQIVTALMGAGMELTLLEEHDTVPWDALPGQMVDTGGGEWRARRPARAAAAHVHDPGAQALDDRPLAPRLGAAEPRGRERADVDERRAAQHQVAQDLADRRALQEAVAREAGAVDEPLDLARRGRSARCGRG